MDLAHRHTVIARFVSPQNLFPQVSLAKGCIVFPWPPSGENLLGDLFGKYLVAWVLVIVFSDIVLERFSLFFTAALNSITSYQKGFGDS